MYRFYVNAMDDSDKLSAVFGNDQAHGSLTPTRLNSTFSFLNVPHQPCVCCCVPGLADDSFATIGLDGLLMAVASLLILPSWKMQHCLLPFLATSSAVERG